MDAWIGSVLLAGLALLFILNKWGKTKKAMAYFFTALDVLVCFFGLLLGAGVVVGLVTDFVSGHAIDLSGPRMGILVWSAIGLYRILHLCKKGGAKRESVPANIECGKTDSEDTGNGGTNAEKDNAGSDVPEQ